MKKFKLVNDHDGNDQIELEATNYGDAVQEAFDQLGWTLTESNDHEKCADCGKPVCFERESQDEPPEYDVCGDCDKHICPDCNVSKTETPQCSHCNSTCPKCGQSFIVHNDDGSCVEDL